MASVFDSPLPVTLSSFKHRWLNSNSMQSIVIDRHSPRPLRDIFKLHKKGLNIRAIPDVEFKGEDGTDASGPTREYFHLSMSLLTAGDSSIQLFEGQNDHLMPIHCVESQDSMLFYYTGVMISHSFLHDGYPLVGLSKAAVAYIITGSIYEAIPFLSIEDVPDYEIRQMLEKVRDANTDEMFKELNENEAIVTMLTAAGFVNKLLTSTNRDAALESAMLHHTLIVRKLEMDDIRRGMETIQLAMFLNRNKELWGSSHVFPQSSQVIVLAESLEKKLVLHSSVKQDDLNEQEKLAFEWCKEYVRCLPVHAEDDYVPTTGMFLQFVLGSPQYPTQPVYVKFNRKEKSLPDPESCLGILSLHVNASSFADFKKKMDATLSAQATGYGRF
ncbi:G2 M phase-specific E3 ubiquitin- ligase [Paramuricea clavata]|uniref:G2 M phase-specific E3 ubiquitin- ligase n=1 Tax=Paramuricea clavata TaxID=317549 RepID=A0A6S7J702_PARCT|nr:G2 M phase-specific E3 ubiquitin- ligase [Paramuricea clavata]